MASKTTNYQLNKIDLTDAPPDITVLNANWDKVDTEMKNNYDKAQTAQTAADGKTTVIFASEIPANAAPGTLFFGDIQSEE